ncbi:receptor-like protein EIX1 [Magnolia sinica]|uniref:receptor-like protein EIX1 n=1 Tax=Magnolia sinica TaxID=86752 RepID=UPI0026580CD2|nr:receptor-like protein EIX1 [Magnolia sinica]
MGGSVRVIFLSVLVFLSVEIIQSTYDGEVKGVCIERERQALLDFKRGLVDPKNWLSSWVGHDCCRWNGVGCNNKTGHVIKLNLRNLLGDPTNDFFTGNCYSSGELNPSLLELRHLTYLDLSLNSFRSKQIPKFIGSFKKLRYLNLSRADFYGTIPHELGNLSSLVYLDLSTAGSYSGLNVSNLLWLSRLSSLQHLHMDNVNLEEVPDWLRVVNMLPSLLELHLSGCGLANITTPLPYLNLTSLSVLDLSSNYQLGPRIPDWLFNLSGLVHLDISAIHLVQGPIPGSLSNLCQLQSLGLSLNERSGEMNGFIESPSGCLGDSLEILDLSVNSLYGPIPEPGFPSLRELYLDRNSLNGTLPVNFGRLSKLTNLVISYNSLVGSVSEAHFSNLTKLESLDLSSNSFVLDVSSDWVPPFQLKEIRMRSCRLGPHFPAWLHKQRNFFVLDLSNAQISDSIPDWFWNLSSSVTYLNLSDNQIKGEIPKLLQFSRWATYSSTIDLSSNKIEGPLPHSFLNAWIWILDLSNNLLSGPIPITFGEISPDFLSLSHNRLNGSIPTSLCKTDALGALDLSYNQLTGELPRCLGDLTGLRIMDLASNNLSGNIPGCSGFMTSLEWLHLRKNNFSGDFPTSLRNCTSLITVDLSWNRFSGNIPTWIGESLSSLRILNLRSNTFSGIIPPQLSHLTSLQIMDLADNNLSGTIPRCFGNFSAMATSKNKSRLIWNDVYADDDDQFVVYEENITVVMKGMVLDYTKTLSLVMVMDLSRNNLSGEIPEELSSLSGLEGLNLSGNHLIGKIPKNIDGLRQLQSLDLSRNQLSGNIPQSLSVLYFLSSLDLSYNQLSGQIPSGTQLQTFNDPSIYIGNLDLCGPPLPKECPKNKASQTPMSMGNGVEEEAEEGEGFEQVWFFTSMAPGFVVGFWGFCGVLIFNKPWRIAYYRFFDKVMDKISVVWVTKVS